MRPGPEPGRGYAPPAPGVPLRMTVRDQGRAAAQDLPFDPGAVAGGPLVSCLMVTRGRGLARLAVDAFRRQTWRERELVVLTAEAPPAFEAELAALDDPRIRLVRVPQQPLGALRNAAVAAARGELVMTWDDDDLYDEARIALLAAALRQAGAAAAFLQRLVLWLPRRRTIALSQPRLWENSMLARRDLLPAFPALPRREDTEVVEMLRARHRVALVDAPWSYGYVVHGGNTFGDRHFDFFLSNATERREGDEAYVATLAVLEARLPVERYLAALEAAGPPARRAGPPPRA